MFVRSGRCEGFHSRFRLEDHLNFLSGHEKKQAPMAHRPEFVFKIIIVGDSGVGKSCLLLRFVDRTFTQLHLNTIGVDFKVCTVELPGGKRAKLQCWDTSGTERFRTVAANYYHGCHGVMLVYDASDSHSFERIRTFWAPEVELHAPTRVPMVLIANKSDLLQHQVSRDDGQKLAAQLGVPFWETSAKQSENVQAVFMDLAKHMEARATGICKSPRAVIVPGADADARKRPCCGK